MRRPPYLVTARRAVLADAECIAGILATGVNPAIVTRKQVRGTLNAGAHCFLLYCGEDLLGLVELRAIHPEPERSDALVVIWLVKRRPVGIGVVALGFILQHAFCTLGLSEVWGYVRNDNFPMRALCRRLGIFDNGIWAGNPEFRLMTCSPECFSMQEHLFEYIHRRLRLHAQ